MALFIMGSDGRSTNTGLTTAAVIDTDGSNVIFFNPLNTTLKVQMGSVTQLSFNVHYNEDDFELVPNNGVITLPSNSGTRVFVNNSSSTHRNMQIDPHGITTAHGTSVHTDGRIYVGLV